jgi:hypothetical protein
MVHRLVRDPFDPPEPWRKKRRLCSEMDRDSRQFTAQRVFDCEVADDWHSVLVERDVDIFCRGARNSYGPTHRVFLLRPTQHGSLFSRQLALAEPAYLKARAP